jgi:hypothetical protein
MGQAFEVVGGRLGGESEVDGFALDGGAHLRDSGLLDGVARGDARHVLADEFLEVLARLVFDDGGFGEQV